MKEDEFKVWFTLKQIRFMMNLVEKPKDDMPFTSEILARLTAAVSVTGV